MHDRGCSVVLILLLLLYFRNYLRLSRFLNENLFCLFAKLTNRCKFLRKCTCSHDRTNLIIPLPSYSRQRSSSYVLHALFTLFFTHFLLAIFQYIQVIYTNVMHLLLFHISFLTKIYIH